MGFDRGRGTVQRSLLDQAMLDEVVVADVNFDELEVKRQFLEASICVQGGASKLLGAHGLDKGGVVSKPRGVFGDKENILP